MATVGDRVGGEQMLQVRGDAGGSPDPVRGSLVRRRVSGWFLGALVLAVVAGCSSAPKPKPLPKDPPSSSSAAPSPSVSASPSPVAPTLPAAAKGKGAKAAKAFVRYYVDTFNYAIQTGDVDQLRRLGAAKCKSCKELANAIEKVYDAGGHVESKGWRVTVVSLVPDQPRSKPILDLGVVLSPERVVSRAGAHVKNYPGGKQPMTIFLVRVRGAWRVARLHRVPS